MTDHQQPGPARGRPAVDAVRRRRPRRARRDARPVGELHRHQPALLGQAGLRRGRAVRPRGHPRRLRRHHAGRVPRGAPRARRRRDVLAQPRRLLLGQRRRGDRDARLPRRAHHHPPRDRDSARRTCSACPGGSRSRCRTDGWILRNAIVWHKPNAMPESVRDRLNCRHELLFLLAKSPAYWFDLDPIREPHKTVHAPRARDRSRRTRPPGRPGSRTRPPKYGPGTPEVTTASRYGGTAATAAGTPTGATPATCGRSPPAPTTGRTSPPTRSTSRCGASPPGASPAGPSSTRSPAAAPPASPRSSSTAGSPASTCRPTSPGSRPGGSPRPSPTRTEGAR